MAKTTISSNKRDPPESLPSLQKTPKLQKQMFFHGILCGFFFGFLAGYQNWRFSKDFQSLRASSPTFEKSLQSQDNKSLTIDKARAPNSSVENAIISHEQEATTKTIQNQSSSFSKSAIKALAQCMAQCAPRQGNCGNAYHPIHKFMIENKNFSFVYIPKVASSSVQHIIRTSLNGTLFKWIDDPNAFKFAFVRDPLERFVSAYMEIIINRQYPRVLSANKEEEFTLFFNKFINGTFQDMNYTIPNHFTPQFNTLRLGRKRLDYIGRSEQLFNEWSTTLKEKIPGLPDFPKKPGSHQRNSKESSKPNLTSEQKQAICSMYCRDFCCLAMEFPPECTQSKCPCEEETNPVYSWLK
mmetsp:Transcript_6280/g.9656  ORF Transcript_6280/g.9656 Transcript_6280/m.9656 type:complete len:354 (-) Transcript_6280:22-1083(-)